MKLALDRIVVGKRLRPVDPARVDLFCEAQAALDQPIIVRPFAGPPPADHQLVAGAHRLAAARKLGRREIEVIIKTLNDLEASLAEIDENLIRADLSALDRAVFLAERKRLWEEMHPEARRGGDRRSRTRRERISNGEALPFGFSRAVAEAVGLSERTIRDAVALVAALGLETTQRLQGTPIAGNASELKALARLDGAKRSKVVDRLTAGEARLAGALDAAGLGKPKADGQEQLFRALVSMWSRATAKTRKRFLAHVEGAAQ